MYVKCNPNPLGKAVGDCVVRAIAVATRRSWRDAYWDICEQGRSGGYYEPVPMYERRY